MKQVQRLVLRAMPISIKITRKLFLFDLSSLARGKNKTKEAKPFCELRSISEFSVWKIKLDIEDFE